MKPETYIHPARRVLVVADRDLAALDHAHRRRLTDAVRGSRVLVVAPAGPVAGERWIVDLTAREARAERRLGDWIRALEPYALAVAAEIGDANPRLALSDARRAFGPDTVVAISPVAAAAPLLRRLRERHVGALPVAA